MKVTITIWNILNRMWAFLCKRSVMGEKTCSLTVPENQMGNHEGLWGSAGDGFQPATQIYNHWYIPSSQYDGHAQHYQIHQVNFSTYSSTTQKFLHLPCLFCFIWTTRSWLLFWQNSLYNWSGRSVLHWKVNALKNIIKVGGSFHVQIDKLPNSHKSCDVCWSDFQFSERCHMYFRFTVRKKLLS